MNERETPEERDLRRRRRRTFDGVAQQYDESRRGYPDELVDLVVATAGLSAGSRVLEIGCGTGQLTRSLVERDLDVMAIDISPSMVATAARHLGDRVRFETCAFEDLDAPDGSFELVASATAFHWIDPDVAFVKAAALLVPAGWLALLATGEVYDEPFGSQLRAMWMPLAPPPATTGPQPGDVDAAVASGQFGNAVARTHERRLTLLPAMVGALERTRATVLDYGPDDRRRYDQGLDELLAGVTEVPLTQRTSLTMVQRLT